MGRGTAKGRAPMFIATVRWESSSHPKYETRRFSCVSDFNEFRDLNHDNAANSAWYIGPRTGLDATARDTFELLDFTIDGKYDPFGEAASRTSQTYSVNLGDDALQSTGRVAMAYTYRTLVAVNEHLIQLRVEQPTKGLVD